MNQVQNPFSNLTPVVKNLLIINIIFFVAKYLLGTIGFSMDRWFSAYYPASQLSHPWQIITYMFMHADFWHILFNMMGLIFMGPILEYTFGSKRFLQYYFITGIGALALQFLVQAVEMYHITGAFATDINTFPTNSMTDIQDIYAIYHTGLLGASGAIFGLLVAVFLIYPEIEVYIYFIPIPVKIKYLVPVYVLYELYTSIRPTEGDNVGHIAHIGGALIGFIIIKIWGYKKQNNFY